MDKRRRKEIGACTRKEGVMEGKKDVQRNEGGMEAKIEVWKEIRM